MLIGASSATPAQRNMMRDDVIVSKTIWVSRFGRIKDAPYGEISLLFFQQAVQRAECFWSKYTMWSNNMWIIQSFFFFSLVVSHLFSWVFPWICLPWICQYPLLNLIKQVWVFLQLFLLLMLYGCRCCSLKGCNNPFTFYCDAAIMWLFCSNYIYIC